MIDQGVLQIKVPGSTANLGPGFDSIGLALSKYVTLTVKKHTEWKFVGVSEDVKDIPEGTDNLIYCVANKLATSFGYELPPCYVEVDSNIPMARGLGSSAAAIIAAIELTNELTGLQLTSKEKLRYASLEEEHPDNVGASLYGGLVVGSHLEEVTELLTFDNVEVDVFVVIPTYEVLTKDARNVLPKELSFQDAVKASAISNVLLSAIIKNDWSLAGKMMSKDLFHESYRSQLIPEVEDVRSLAKRYGAYGVALSGAGPTVIGFTEKGTGDYLVSKLKNHFEGYLVEKLEIDYVGSKVSWSPLVIK